MYKVTKRQRLMALGGTFDHFHKGHESFINYAFKYANRLIIGVTNNKFAISKDYSQSLQPYKLRVKSVINFCKKNNINCEIVTLSDPYGPTIDRDNKKIDSVCVTPETLPGAEKINEIRQAYGMEDLDIFVAPLVNSDQGKPLHAIEIRSGKINRQGITYISKFNKDIKINKQQRSFLSKPLGPVISSASHKKNTTVAVVGDYALSQFIEKNWLYTIGVYDKKTKREFFESSQLKNIKPDIKINNPAGLISYDSLEKLSKMDYKDTGNKKHILVDGEEDLVAVSLILTMPLHSLIYYGQPDQGMVLLKVTEKLKEKISKLILK